MPDLNELNLQFPDKAKCLFGDSRYVCLYGGRASGKSWAIVRYLIIKAITEKHNILCARQFQNSISASVYKLICDQISAMGLSAYFHITNKEILCKTTGSVFTFIGIKRDPEKIKSLENATLCFVEEGESVSSESWRVLIPTLRAEGSRILIAFNPNQPDDPTYKKFVVNPPKSCVSVLMTYLDNPWCSQIMIDEAEEMRISDPEMYSHVWLGTCLQKSDQQVLWDRCVVDEFTPKNNWNASPLHGLDYGFSGDPMAFVRCWIYDKTLWIEAESTGVRIENDDIVDHILNDVPSAAQYEIRCDNSRPETTSHIRKNGLPNAVSCTKGADSIKEGIAYLRSFNRIVIHPRCKFTIREAQLYRHKLDPLSGQVLPAIIDKHNNSWDAVRYAIQTTMPTKSNHSTITTTNSNRQPPRLPR